MHDLGLFGSRTWYTMTREPGLMAEQAGEAWSKTTSTLDADRVEHWRVLFVDETVTEVLDSVFGEGTKHAPPAHVETFWPLNIGYHERARVEVRRGLIAV